MLDDLVKKHKFTDAGRFLIVFENNRKTIVFRFVFRSFSKTIVSFSKKTRFELLVNEYHSFLKTTVFIKTIKDSFLKNIGFSKTIVFEKKLT